MTIAGSLRTVAAALGTLMRRRREPRHAPRIVRRTTVHCPWSGAPVEVDLLMRRTGAPDAVLRCSARRECPPACDQACKDMAEAALAPVRVLIVLPPGGDLPDEID
jgi:hypothetical protein